MNTPSHQGLYRNTPLILGGLLAAIALLIAGVALALQIATTGKELLPLIFGALGGFVVIFVAFMLAALRRHRWTVEPDAVRIEERPLVPLTGRRRARRVAFGDIATLSNVQNGAEDLLALTTRNGERFMLPPGLAPGEGLIRKPDQQGLTDLAQQLQGAMSAAGRQPPPVIDGLGFWNRPVGLAVMSVAFLLALALAGVALWGLWEGAVVRHKSGEAVAILVLLPVGVAWMLHRSWRRRRAVLQALRTSNSG